MRSCEKNRAAAQGSRGGSISWGMAILVVSLALMACTTCLPGPAEKHSSGRLALRGGDYAGAQAHFESALKSQPDHPESQIGLLETLRETGAYAEAEARAGEFLERNGNSAPLHLERGRLAAARGDYAGAENHLRRSAALGGGPIRLQAVKERALLLEEVGKRDEAKALWEQLIAEYRRGQVRGSAALGAMAVAAWHRGYIQDAKDIFIDATTTAAGAEISLEALADFGYLFLEKYDARNGADVFRDCLNINKSYPPALLGMALARRYDGNAEVESYARAALAVNPNLVPAIVLLAELQVEAEDYEAALEGVRRALSVNPSSLEALSLEAVCHYLRGDTPGFSDAERKVLAINPAFGRLYHIVAENMVTRRKYREAVEYNRMAIELDPDNWPALTSLGMNLMRIGDLAGGRRALEQAFDGDPFDIWAFNTLQLLDQMDAFIRSKSEHFDYLMDTADDSSLSPYLSKLAEEAYVRLTRRYGFEPEGQLQIEVFPDHGGFAVRTLGLPGLGALGVCFGTVVALDSPRAREEGAFNWGSTLWHELAHVITLQMTKHNIPRWYSEGISVYEERRARPGWGDDLTASIVKAYKEGKLLKVSELNSGMTRPKSPQQVSLSYYQASLFCELIEEKFGFDKIPQSLKLFAENLPAADVFRRTLGWDAETMDREYARFLEARLQNAAAHLDFQRLSSRDASPGGRKAPEKEKLLAVLKENPDDFFANLQLGALLREQKSNREAEVYLRKAQELFPEFVQEGNPYELLGDMYLEERREADALAQFLAWTRYDETAFPPLVEAAKHYSKSQDWRNVAEVLERAIYIRPYDSAAQEMLGEAAEKAGNWPTAAAAYRVLVGLNSTDPAGAHYRLARALLGMGKGQEAKREVLKALEIAPSYAPALDLLLQLSGGGP